MFCTEKGNNIIKAEGYFNMHTLKNLCFYKTVPCGFLAVYFSVWHNKALMNKLLGCNNQYSPPAAIQWFFMFLFCFSTMLCRPWHTCSDGAPDHQRCAWQLLPGEDGVPALHRQLQPSRTIHLETWEHAHRTEQGQRSGHLRTALHSGTHEHIHSSDTWPGVPSGPAFCLQNCTELCPPLLSSLTLVPS